MTSENPENPVNQQQAAINAEGKTDEHSAEPSPLLQPATRETHPSPAPDKCETTCNTKRDWIDKTTLGFEAVGLLVLIIYTVATIVYACITRSMWNEIRTQTATGQRQLEQAERPWLKVDMAVVWFEFTADGGASVTVQPKITNVGHSVATNITFAAVMIAPQMDTQNLYYRMLKERQNNLCNKMDEGGFPGPDMIRKVIFPTDSDDSESSTFSITRYEIETAKRPDGTIIPFIIGCVDYQFPTALRVHRTPFIYMLGAHDQTLPQVFPYRWIKIGEHLKGSDVTVTKWPFGGFDAY